MLLLLLVPCVRLLDVITGNVYEMQCWADRHRNGVPAVIRGDEMDGVCSTTKEVRNAKAVSF
jgi:hypothetical protein